MNASGRLNTCKSRGIVAILETGARVRNAYAIYLLQRDSPEKFGLIPHSIVVSHDTIIKVTTAKDEHASH
jgi:hypothetical protein